MIPASVQIKLESADLTFTSLVKGEVYGEGKTEYHHEEPSEDGDRRQATARLPGLAYSGNRSTVCTLPKFEDDQDSEHSVEVESGHSAGLDNHHSVRVESEHSIRLGSQHSVRWESEDSIW